MRFRRSRGFHGIKRPAIRQSWNKYNLYNLSCFRSPVKLSDSLFKQKWVARSVSRKYHGETLNEKAWQRLWRPTVRAVLPMDPAKLAADDGRAHAAGRGAGLERDPSIREPSGRRPTQEMKPIPYQNMVYAALERRLETAVFRAMFASSTRQARQMCIHGFVKVNGKTMVYPGYNLNPGDLFQVDPERVMYATGAPKDREQRREGRVLRRKAANAAKGGAAKASEANEGTEISAPADSASSNEADTPLHAGDTLIQLLETSRVMMSKEKQAPAKRKQALREFTRLVRRALSQRGSPADRSAPPASGMAEIQQLMDSLNLSAPDGPFEDAEKTPSDTESPTATGNFSAEPADASSSATVKPVVPLGETLTVRSHERAQLEAALQAARENPIDATKPYGTPWQPRPWMSPFACIPRYLEVHSAICAAVYLRHPVARPGQAEVPTPFDADLLSLARGWYLRQR